MSDNRPKLAIPAWQRATQPRPAPIDDPVSSQHESAQSQPVDSEAKPEADDQTAAAAASDEDPPSVPSADTSPTTAQLVDTEPTVIGSGDIDHFKEQQLTKSTYTQQQESLPPPPPIITYPEFLVEARKPPPLITPTRILNSVYAAGSLAAVLYGASKWLVNPMVEQLGDSRHEFFSYSQDKLDEFNERLSKIVSKVPGSKRAGFSPDDELEETASVTSDPTELYHRDMGTQTSPVPSRRPSLSNTAEPKKDAVTYGASALNTMKSHIDELATGAEKNAEANKDRQESMNKLRHYLDGLIYGSPTINAWQTSDDTLTSKNGSGNNEDAIDELKKEIRGVKGVLLSAKRFPSVNRPVTAT